MKQVLLSTEFEYRFGNEPTYTIALIELDTEFVIALNYDAETETWSQGIYSVVKTREVEREFQLNYLAQVAEFAKFHTGYKIKTA